MDGVGLDGGQQNADIATVGIILGNAVLVVQEPIVGSAASVGVGIDRIL